MVKRKQTTCDCEAYSFPHRFNSGKCCEETRNPPTEYRERDSLQSLGLVSLFAPDNRRHIQF